VVIDPTDGRVDVVVLTPGCRTRMVDGLRAADAKLVDDGVARAVQGGKRSRLI